MFSLRAAYAVKQLNIFIFYIFAEAFFPPPSFLLLLFFFLTCSSRHSSSLVREQAIQGGVSEVNRGSRSW